MGHKTILIATPLYVEAVGGTSNYSENLAGVWRAFGCRVEVAGYGPKIEGLVGIRHLRYFWQLYKLAKDADFILALDTFSVGLPALMAGFLRRKKVVVRVSGDLLWEQFIKRTHSSVKLSEFYRRKIAFSFKEWTIYLATKITVKMAWRVVFSTAWQSELWQKVYGISNKKIAIIKDSFAHGRSQVGDLFPQSNKFYIWAGVDIYLKNLDKLKKAFQIAKKKNSEIDLKLLVNTSRKNVLKEIYNSYAVIAPSFSEVSSNLVLEALSFNKPIILTEDNGMRDLLGNNVLYVNPFDVDDIADKIIYLADEKNYAEYKRRISGIDFSRSYRDIADDFERLFIKY